MRSICRHALLIVSFVVGPPLWAREQQAAPPENPLKPLVLGKKDTLIVRADDSEGKNNAVFAKLFTDFRKEVETLYENDSGVCGAVVFKLKVKGGLELLDITVSKVIKTEGWPDSLQPLSIRARGFSGDMKGLAQEVFGAIPRCTVLAKESAP